MSTYQKRTTYNQKFDRAIKFYDFAYHVQKSTYKGLASFYKRYSETQRYYADSLINLTRQAWTEIPELARQNPALVATIKQIINSMQTSSQLHFNYSDRLMQVSSTYNAEYFSAKRKKDNTMKILKDKNEDEYNIIKEKEKLNRNAINSKQKDICKVLYQYLDKLADEESERIHKIKEQTIMYFTLYKKVCQKQLESTSEYNLRLVKQQIQIKNPQIAQIAEELRNQYNEYGGEQIQRRSYDSSQPLSVNRQSLRQSMFLKQRMSKFNQTQNQLRKMVEDYESTPDNLILMNSDYYCGIFDNSNFSKEQRRKYGRELNSQVIRNIAFDMIQGYSKSANMDSDRLTLLQLIKANLKVKYTAPTLPDFKSTNFNNYCNQVRQQITDQQYLFHIRVLQQLPKVSAGNFINLNHIINKRQKKQFLPSDIKSQVQLNFPQKNVIIDILLDTVCVTRQNQPILTPSFNEYCRLIAQFGENFLNFDRSNTILLLLRKLDRLIGVRDTHQQIQLLFNESYFTQNPNRLSNSKGKTISKQQNQIITSWVSSLRNNSTHKLCYFYDQKSSYLNSLKILLAIQKMGLMPNSSFYAREHFYKCIRCAGFNYLKSSQKSNKIFDSQSNAGQDRIKNIVQGIEQLDYQGIIITYISPATQQISQLLGVGQKKVRQKLFQQFTYPVYQFINANLNLLTHQEGIDRDGYVLRLGIILAKLDIENPQPISEYDTFFKVLKTYLEATQKDYDNMLQHSRKTQLWIMEENSLATPNCIDFCSLLYKPFQFLLISLKELEKSKKTQYTKKYSQFIKLRLNTVLRNQIIKYINFLYESLANYKNQPSELSLKPKRLEKPHLLSKQQTQKERLGFKQLTRRLFNLLFLKDQLEEMISDFLDQDIYQKLDHSIFNVDKLNKVSSQSPEYRELLTNIKQIIEAVLFNQQRLVKRIANITVFHFMSKVFENLYYQADKNAIEQFFSNATDYKLSQHTFLKYQQTMEDWFLLISKNIPDPFANQFAVQFARSFYEAIECQVLNSTKFKLPLKQVNVIPYLDSDVAFITTMMKQKFFDQNTIIKQIKSPFKDLLSDLQTETPKLANMFEAATLKNDKQRCRYILVILNLRLKDQRAMQFVKKYKAIGAA